MAGALHHSWPRPGSGSPETAFGIRRGRAVCVLVIPPLFEEMNRTRRLLCDTVRALDALGIDAVLPDLPGCNESLADFADQTVDGWRAAMTAAAAHFGATQGLALRGGALVAPDGLPGWAVEPVNGASVLKALIRTRVVAAKEAGRDENAADLLAHGARKGLLLAGYSCGAALIAGLEAVLPAPHMVVVRLADLGGGSALWLRAEPGEDAALAQRLAAFVAGGTTP